MTGGRRSEAEPERRTCATCGTPFRHHLTNCDMCECCPLCGNPLAVHDMTECELILMAWRPRGLMNEPGIRFGPET